MGDGHQLADPIERVGLAASMPAGLVLHAAAGLVEHEVGEFHHVERIGDLDGVREHRVEHRPIRSRQIQRRPLDRLAPLDGLLSEPRARRCGVSTRHDVEELAAGDVDDLGRPTAVSEAAEPAEQHLIEPHSGGGADAVGVVDQRSAVRNDGIHHGVPVAAEIGRNFRHGAAVVADLERRPPTGTIGDRSALLSDAFVGLDEGHNLTRHVRASPPLLRPDQAGLASEAGQIDQFDLESVVRPHLSVAARTGRPLCWVVIAMRRKCGQSPTPFTLTSGRPTSSSHMRVGLVSNRGSSGSGCVRHTQIRRAPARARGPRPTSTHAQIRSAP